MQKELRTLDCGKFISELTESLLESAGNTLKSKEIFSCIELCMTNEKKRLLYVVRFKI